MDYILRGNDKDVANVIKEQRIRIGRGVIEITPLDEAVVTKEDMERMLGEQMASRDAKIEELEMGVKEKDEMILALTAERDDLAGRFEPGLVDGKILSVEDSKKVDVSDSKNLENTDGKSAPVEDKKACKISK